MLLLWRRLDVSLQWYNYHVCEHAAVTQVVHCEPTAIHLRCIHHAINRLAQKPSSAAPSWRYWRSCNALSLIRFHLPLQCLVSCPCSFHVACGLLSSQPLLAINTPSWRPPTHPITWGSTTNAWHIGAMFSGSLVFLVASLLYHTVRILHNPSQPGHPRARGRCLWLTAPVTLCWSCVHLTPYMRTAM